MMNHRKEETGFQMKEHRLEHLPVLIKFENFEDARNLNIIFFYQDDVFDKAKNEITGNICESPVLTLTRTTHTSDVAKCKIAIHGNFCKLYLDHDVEYLNKQLDEIKKRLKDYECESYLYFSKIHKSLVLEEAFSVTDFKEAPSVIYNDIKGKGIKLKFEGSK